jgi:hypothetical protein
MKILNFKIVIVLNMLFILIAVLMSACKCPSCEEEEAKVPLVVLEKSNSYIISKTGEDIFNNYIAPDFFRTRHTPPYYEMVYKFYMPEKPFVDALIKFTVDSVGNVLEYQDIIGIPKCRYFPQQCNFKIDEETAMQIAANKGLEEGIKDWKVGFIWNVQQERYVWHVLSTLNEMEGDFGYRGSGKEMIIDPINGEVLALNDWKIN